MTLGELKNRIDDLIAENEYRADMVVTINKTGLPGPQPVEQLDVQRDKHGRVIAILQDWTD